VNRRQFVCGAAASLSVLTLAAGARAAAGQPAAADLPPDAVAAALAGTHRSEADRARDPHRHPRETLAFFGLRPEMTVIEIAPGEGWYSAILAPVLREKGMLYAGVPGPNGAGRAYLSRYLNRLVASPAVYDKVGVQRYDAAAGVLDVPAGQADLVLVMRHMHGLMRQGWTAPAMAAWNRALAPGGVLGIEQHRAPEGSALEPKSGYVTESAVVAAAAQAGFRLADRAEINANPRDSRDHPGGVWSLPPTLSQGAANRRHYRAIGESDRMTLRFIKERDLS